MISLSICEGTKELQGALQCAPSPWTRWRRCLTVATGRSTVRLSSGTPTTTQHQSLGQEWWVAACYPLLDKHVNWWITGLHSNTFLGSWFLFRTLFLLSVSPIIMSHLRLRFQVIGSMKFWHSKPCCSAFSVYHKRCPGTGHLKLASHARQGAELCQRPLPDGRRHPQPASAAQTQRPLHPDRSG